MLKVFFKNQMAQKTLLIASSVLVLNSCDKGGSSFSVLSDSSTFQQTAVFEPRKLDVLFLVDNSGSMAASQTNLANNFSSFIDRFISKGYDFKIAVGTSDAFYGDQFLASGCSLCNVNQTRFRSGVTPSPVYIIDKNNYDLTLASEVTRLKSDFSLNVKVGTNGSGDERAFSSIKAVLNSSLNSGFHRSDAYLSVIIISDADDFSHDDINLNESYAQPTLHTVQTYVDFLNTFTVGLPTVNYSVSTIGVLDTACRDLLNVEKKISTRYMNLSDLTGGTKNSICSPFSSVLDNISSTIEGSQSSVYKLNKKPIISSIRVVIRGILISQDATNGWTYNVATNAIEIHGTAKPAAGDSVVINFDPDLN